jgi:hypothetical protein
MTLLEHADADGVILPDCGDNSCIFSSGRGGMRTNGGCRCFEGLEGVGTRKQLNHMARVVRWMRGKVEMLTPNGPADAGEDGGK